MSEIAPQPSLLLDGRWCEGEGPPLESTDPATGERLWQGRCASPAQIHQALHAARRALPDWQALPLARRIGHLRAFVQQLHQHKDRLARLISRENGKPLWDAQTEVAAMTGKIDIAIRAHQERTGEVEKDTAAGALTIRHKPHGVVAVLGPFNFPAHLPNGHIVPALLAGNCVLFKPSEHTPAVARLTMECWQAAGLPPGVLNLLQGDRATAETLLQAPQLDGLYFTGSAHAGLALHRAWAGQPDKILALEMGGNNPLILEPVTEVDAALHVVLFSAFVSSGQRCTCARRLLVPDTAWGDQFIQQLVRRSAALRVAPGLSDPQPFMGALISAAAAQQVQAAVQSLQGQGAASLLTGKILNPQGTLLTPAILDVSTLTDLPDQEIFGPVLQIQRYQSREQAIEQANATRSGLAAGVISDDTAGFEHYFQRLRAGIINFNKPLTGASSEAPFGGIGASGNHRPSAYYAADYCAYPVASLRDDRVRLPAQIPPGMSP